MTNSPATSGTAPAAVPLTTGRVPTSPLLTYVGMAVAAGGFLLLLLAWGVVAGKSEVHDQLPVLLAAGLGGLGVIMVGLTAVNVAAQRMDASSRARELDQLLLAIEELRSTLEPDEAAR